MESGAVEVLVRGADAPALDLIAETTALADGVASPSGARVLIVVPDRTRAFPLREVLPALIGRLLERGAMVARITVAVASGTHRPADHELSARHLGELPPGVRVLRHDADATGTRCGMTPAGTPVEVNPALLESDTVLALGTIVFHYFAGFGGGGKMLFPGLGTRNAIAANHRRALGPLPPGGLAPGVEPGRLEGNPVAWDLADVHALLPAASHLTLWPVTGGFAGSRWRTPGEFRALSARYADGRHVGARAAYDVVLATCAGPGGLDVVQAHKALFHAALYSKDGGEVIFEAACPEGAGSAAMERWLASPDRAALEREARRDYDLNAQTAISLAAIAERVRVTWVSPEPLPALARWGVRRANDATLESARASSAAGDGARIARIPAPTDVLPVDPVAP